MTAPEVAPAELLRQHFDEAFSAPDGIKRLRELILTLAMQGKLVEQDPSEGAAAELLEQIATEKKRLVKERKIKAPKPLPEVEDGEKPYELPQGWAWVRLKEISHDWGQKVPESTFTYIDVGSINNQLGKVADNVQQVSAEEASSRARKVVKRGTVIYSTIRPYLLNIAIIEDEYSPEPIASTAFAILHPYGGIDGKYLYYFLRSSVINASIERKMKGVAYPAIGEGEFFQELFPSPPLAEQRRIVARIDQLMARCDQLEALRQQQEQKRTQAHRAALREVTADQDPASFAQHWQFLAEHFGELHATPQSVTELRGAVLQLAVMGKLVSQDAGEGTAAELLEQIQAEKKRLVREGKIKAPKPLPPVTEAEQPYQVPEGWAWVRLDDIATLITDGTHFTPTYVDSGVPFLSVKDLSGGYIDFSSTRYISEAEHTELSKRCNPEYGDILLTKVGTTGIAIPILIEKEFSIFVSVALIKLVNSLTDSEYLARLLNSPHCKRQSEEGTEGVGNKNLVLRKIKAFTVPLPPLAEQRRIVAKVDQFMGLCDVLEERIAAQGIKQGQLLGAVMAQLAPSVVSARPVAVSGGRGRPKGAVTQAASGAGRGRGRPRKATGEEPARSIPQATSEAEAIRRLEALQLERARGDKMVSLFEEGN